jgi:hypothetical protein
VNRRSFGSLVGFGLAFLGCFDLPPANVVDGVRILATRADLPYAKPGETVSLDVLAVDGRATSTTPMRLFWIPTPCLNPPGDNYFGCYPQLPAGGLVSGDHLTFTMPANAITGAPPHPGAPTPYGVAFVFVIACAGSVEAVPVDTRTESPLTIPFGCFDDANTPVGADGFVFAFARVYAYTDLRNGNPIIDRLTFGGAPVDEGAGIHVHHCTESDITKCTSSKSATAPNVMDVVVPAASWEVDPGALTLSGASAHEAIWVDYYTTGGRFANDSVVLFDANSGRASSNTGNGYAAQTAGTHAVWAVVRDTRGGVSWLTVPVHAE